MNQEKADLKKEKKKKKKKNLPVRLAALIPIAVIVVAIVVFNLFFFGTVLKPLAEKGLTAINQAPVLIKKIDANLFKSSLAIHGLEWTDKEKQSKNSFEFTYLAGDINNSALFKGKYHLDQMVIQNLRLNQANGRKEVSQGQSESEASQEVQDSAEGSETEPSADSESSFLSDFDASAYIQSQDLPISKEYQQFDSNIAGSKEKWDSKLSGDPISDDLNSDVESVKNIDVNAYKTAADLPKLKKDLDNVQSVSKNLKKEKSEFDSLKAEFSKDRKVYQNQYSRLKSMKNNGYKAFLIEGENSPLDAKSLLGPLLGEGLSSKIENYQNYFEMIQPFLPKKKSGKKEKKEPEALKQTFGKTILFPDYETAKVRVGEMALNGFAENGEPFDAKVLGYSTLLRNEAIRYSLSVGSNQTLDIRGKILETNNKVAITGKGGKKNLQLNSFFPSSDALDIQGKGDLDISYYMEKDGARNFELRLNATSAKMNYKKADNQLGKILQAELGKIQTFYIQVSMTQKSNQKAKITVKSDLSDRINQAMKNQLKSQIDAYNRQIKAAYQKEANQYLSQANDKLNTSFDLKELNKQEKQINSAESTLKTQEDKINKKTDDIKSEQSKKLEDSTKEATEKVKKNLPGGLSF